MTTCYDCGHKLAAAIDRERGLCNVCHVHAEGEHRAIVAGGVLRAVAGGATREERADGAEG